MWGRYGLWWYGPTPWYDPWYDPWFMYGGYPYGYGMAMYGYSGGYGAGSSGGSGGGSHSSEEYHPETGSLRLRVDPEKAQVYVDGVLQGVVDDFNGLSGHLNITGGTHMLELRANGFVSLKDEIIVETNRTQTYRASLKKSAK